MRAPIGTMTGKVNGLASNTPIMLKTPPQIWDSLISSDESTLISNDFDSSKKTQFLTASETLILPEIVKPKETLAEVKKETKIKKETKPKKQKTLEEGVYSAVLSEGLENRLDMTEASDVILTNMFRCFQSPKNEASEEWREGNVKAAFNYLLVDPRITQNLPVRAKNMSEIDTFRTFVSAIFYIGKGSRARP